ncbi:MAG TPA: DUF222 domain-containing protein, partial [Longimicrobiales bacterium]|nr:DUF222 domain-containing protein [Longimicrobiales bacterium]
MPAAEPFDDVDALEALEHEILTLEAHLQAAKHRFLALLAEFDRREGWRLAEHRSCAHWLQHRSGMSLRTAREQVRVARALESLPRIAAAMSRGELHYCQVRALVRVATPGCEAELLEVAKSATTAELERFVRRWRWRWISGADEERRERERHRLRRLVVFPDEGGMYVVRGRVTAEVGALLMRTIEAASDALFCAEAAEETTPEQRRADALGLLAERAMAAGFGGDGRAGAPGPDPEGGREGEAEEADDGSRERSADGISAGAPASRPTERGSCEPCGCGGSGRAVLSGTRAERYQVFVHVDPGTLGAADEGDALPAGPHGIARAPAPRSHLEDGT